MIFEVVTDVEPADYAEEKWKTIKTIINDSDIGVGFVQFYRHFWISKYKKSSVAKLYDDFKTTIRPKSEKIYKQFLQEMEKCVKLYVKVVSPQKKDFDNKKEYFGIIQSMNVMSDTFNVVQVRIALMALIEAKDKGLITLSQLKDCIYYLEGFHFSYNSLAARPTNRLESIYSRFSIKLRNCDEKVVARETLKSLISDLEEIYISYQEFEEKFIKLSFAKTDDISNIKTKYALNKIASHYENSELFDAKGSIEHIIPEAEGNQNNNIGNLILLELELNRKADSMQYDEKIDIYKESRYKWVEKFVQENSSWESNQFEARSKSMAKYYYTEILNRNINA